MTRADESACLERPSRGKSTRVDGDKLMLSLRPVPLADGCPGWVLAAALVLPAFSQACCNSEDTIVNGATAVEAVVLGSVETSRGEPVEGVSIQIEAWRGTCGAGDPVEPSAPASQLVTDSTGLYYALFREDADPYEACLTARADPPAVLHLLPDADTGAVLSFKTSEEPRDTVEIDYVLIPERPILYRAISAESYRTCALSTRGAAFCWGAVGLGSVSGIWHFDTSAVPLAVPGALQFTGVDGTTGHGCGITSGGAAFCWGANDLGQLGDGTGGGNEGAGSRIPVAVVGGHSFTTITTGIAESSCGVTTEGTGLCWGNNFVGQLGTGSEDWYSPVPVPVAGGLRFADIEAGSGFACGITDSGAGYCWGVNAAGQLGNGTTTDSRSPVPVAGGLSLSEIDPESNHACAIATDGGTYCWGDNLYGQLGDGTTLQATTPVEVVTGVAFVSVATGGFHSCGLTEEGQAYCWGLNDRGQLGDGTQTTRHAPTPVATELLFLSIAAGRFHTCSIEGGGTAYCWGSGSHGELGNGSAHDHSTPVVVDQPE